MTCGWPSTLNATWIAVPAAMIAANSSGAFRSGWRFIVDRSAARGIVTALLSRSTNAGLARPVPARPRIDVHPPGGIVADAAGRRARPRYRGKIFDRDIGNVEVASFAEHMERARRRTFGSRIR